MKVLLLTVSLLLFVGCATTQQCLCSNIWMLPPAREGLQELTLEELHGEKKIVEDMLTAQNEFRMNNQLDRNEREHFRDISREWTGYRLDINRKIIELCPITQQEAIENDRLFREWQRRQIAIVAARNREIDEELRRESTAREREIDKQLRRGAVARERTR